MNQRCVVSFPPAPLVSWAEAWETSQLANPREAESGDMSPVPTSYGQY